MVKFLLLGKALVWNSFSGSVFGADFENSHSFAKFPAVSPLRPCKVDEILSIPDFELVAEN